MIGRRLFAVYAAVGAFVAVLGAGYLVTSVMGDDGNIGAGLLLAAAVALAPVVAVVAYRRYGRRG